MYGPLSGMYVEIRTGSGLGLPEEGWINYSIFSALFKGI